MKPKLRLVLFPIISILIELVIVKIGIVFMEPDDYLIAGIVGGAYGEGSNQIIMAPFISVILCLLLHAINIITGFFNTYTIFLLIMLALCFFNMHYLIIKKQLPWIWHIMVCILEIMFMCFLTFTTVAYLLAGTGVLLLSCLDENDKISPPSMVLGLISLSFGIMLRNEVLFTVGLLLAPVLISVFRQNKKAFFVTIAYGLLFFILITVANRIAYKSSEIWSSYYEWDETSVKMRDYTPISYDKYEELFQKEDWTRNDLEMNYSWQFADKNIFGKETINRIVSEVKLQDRYEVRIKALLLSMIRNKNVWLAIALTTVLLAFIRDRKTRWLTFISLVMLSGLILALYFRARYVSRVAVPIMVLGVLQLIMINKETFADTDKKKKALLNTICFVVIAGFMMVSVYGRVGIIRQKTNNIALAEYVHNNADNIYIMNSGVANSLNDATPIKDISKEIYCYNVIKAGSWDSFSGRYYEQTKVFGFTHPESVFRELADNSSAYYITSYENDAQRIKILLEEHYDITVEVNEIDADIPNAIIYSFKKDE